MKTWILTIKKADAETVVVEADKLLHGKTGNLVFLRKEGDGDAAPISGDSPFYQLEGFTIVRVQGAGTYADCVLQP